MAWSRQTFWLKLNQKCQAGFRPLCNKILAMVQDHTSQDHFCSVINEFPVWNSKSFKPRWWDTVPHPEREADLKLQCFWSLMIAHCSIMSSDGWGIVWVAYFYVHLSSRCIATQGGAASPFFRVCIQLLLSYKQRNGLIRFLFLNETSAQTPFK